MLHAICDPAWNVRRGTSGVERPAWNVRPGWLHLNMLFIYFIIEEATKHIKA